MRSGEAYKLQWTDIDSISKIIRVTPEKNSEPRIFKVSEKLIGMLNALPKNSKRVFGDVIEKNRRVTFHASRKRTAQKLQNPRILQIHFHTLRHWKATLLYHQTKDILYVMRFLGHKNIKNTLLYIQLAEVLFEETSE
jgi:integrase